MINHTHGGRCHTCKPQTRDPDKLRLPFELCYGFLLLLRQKSNVKITHQPNIQILRDISHIISAQGLV